MIFDDIRQGTGIMTMTDSILSRWERVAAREVKALHHGQPPSACPSALEGEDEGDGA